MGKSIFSEKYLKYFWKRFWEGKKGISEIYAGSLKLSACILSLLILYKYITKVEYQFYYFKQKNS
jgi:hypothetical protein